jgi:hypothetical protein
MRSRGTEASPLANKSKIKLALVDLDPASLP